MVGFVMLMLREPDGVTRIVAFIAIVVCNCLLYTSDAADERSSVDLGGRRIIKKKNTEDFRAVHRLYIQDREQINHYKHTDRHITRNISP